VTKHCRRDKESVAKFHRNKITGARSSEADKQATLERLARVVVNLARLRPAKQKLHGGLDSAAVFMVIRMCLTFEFLAFA
jgi:hypothetical protein